MLILSYRYLSFYEFLALKIIKIHLSFIHDKYFMEVYAGLLLPFSLFCTNFIFHNIKFLILYVSCFFWVLNLRILSVYSGNNFNLDYFPNILEFYFWHYVFSIPRVICEVKSQFTFLHINNELLKSFFNHWFIALFMSQIYFLNIFYFNLLFLYLVQLVYVVTSIFSHLS